MGLWNISWLSMIKLGISIIACTVGKYVCSIVGNNIWSLLWLSIIWLLIHNLNMNTQMHHTNMDIHNSMMDTHNKMIYWHLAIHVITIIIIIIIIIIKSSQVKSSQVKSSQVKNISLQYKKNVHWWINKTEAHSGSFVLHINNVFV